MKRKTGIIFLVLTSLVIVFAVIGFYIYSHKLYLNDLAENRVLAWNDEFDDLDTSVWDYETGSVRNNELQLYVDSEENVFCKDGVLHIKAIKNNPQDGYEWSSGSIISRKGFAFGNGLIEAKVKYDPQKGCWPAFWGKGYNYWRDYEKQQNLGLNWPECGELDMAEFTYEGKYAGGAFWLSDDTGSQDSARTSVSDFTFDNGWHIIGMERSDDGIDFYYDRNYVGTLSKEEFQDELYTPYNVILNLAIGGGSQGQPDGELTETEFLVDWIRYYVPETTKKVDKVKTISLDCGDEFELKIGQRRILQPSFDVENPDNYFVDWTSSNEEVATCYAGTVKALSTGTTTITATTETGIKVTTTLEVKEDATNPTEEIDLYIDSLYLDYNTTAYIRTVVTPEYRSNLSLNWESSDESVATVQDGTVTAVSENGGNVTITCKSADGTAEASIDITCKPKPEDTIDTNGIVAKYTKNGWSSDAWNSDLENGIDFNTTGDSSTGFQYLSGLGYQQKYISDSSIYAEQAQHYIEPDQINIDGPFTVAVRYFYPAGAENSGGNVFEICKNDGKNEGTIQLQSNHLYAKDLQGNNVIDLGIDIDEDTSHDRVINVVLVKDENKELSVFVNGKLSCKSDSFSSIPNLNLSGIQVGIGNKAITNAVYQALLVYNRALSEAEVQDLNISLNVMYQ